MTETRIDNLTVHETYVGKDGVERTWCRMWIIARGHSRTGAPATCLWCAAGVRYADERPIGY